MLSVLFTTAVLANEQQSYANFKGTSSAVAEKDLWDAGGGSWDAKIHSYTSPAVNIGTIGWTWWTFRELCDGVIGDNYPQTGYALYGASDAWDVGVDDKSPCSGTRQGGVLGKHDFKEGALVWQPEFSAYGNLP